MKYYISDSEDFKGLRRFYFFDGYNYFFLGIRGDLIMGLPRKGNPQTL